jgi:hypothetical protein
MSCEDYTVFIMYLILGLPILASYWGLSKQSTKTIGDFWSNQGRVKWLNNPMARKLFMVSFLIAALSGIYLFYYFTWGNDKNGVCDKKIFGLDYEDGGKYFIYVAYLLIFVFSLLWIPSFKISTKMFGNLSTLVLYIVSAGSILLLSSLISMYTDDNNSVTAEDKVAMAAVGYFAFHTVILDGMLWTGSIKI